MVESADGMIYIADSYNHRVVVCDTSGNRLLTLEGPGLGTGPGELSYPTNLAIPDGTRLYFSEFGGHRVTMFDPDLHFIGSFGDSGAGPGQFHQPWGIAVNARGEVLVSDELNHRISASTPTATSSAPGVGPGPDGAGSTCRPASPSTRRGGDFWISNTYNHRIDVFSYRAPPTRARRTLKALYR